MTDYAGAASLVRFYGLQPKRVPLGLAALLAAGILTAPSAAEARITKIVITSAPNTIAFGGHSFPGVGQYEVITGIATGEVDGKDGGIQVRHIIATDEISRVTDPESMCLAF